MADERLEAVIYGREIPRSAIDDIALKDYYRIPSPGDFVEISEESSFLSDIRYRAEYIPVFSNGILKGICNANELRFWLLEHHKNGDIFITG
jgi:hypothetical protein